MMMAQQTSITPKSTTTINNSKINFFILMLVVMSLGKVHGASSIDSGEGSGSISSAGSGQLKHSTESDNSPSRQVNSLFLIPRLEHITAAAQKKAFKGEAGGIERDDDHSNIELDRLQEISKYALVGDQNEGAPIWSTALTSNIENNNINNDPHNLERLFSRITYNNNNKNSPSSAWKLNEYAKNLMERKRSIRALQNREDKDYSFIVQPHQPYQQQQGSNGMAGTIVSQPQHMMLMNRFYTNPQQYEQRISNKWMAQKLRDMKLADGGYQAANFRAAPLLDFDTTDINRNSYLDQLSQVNSRSFNDGSVGRFPYNNNAINSEIIPEDALANSREKRRRCKMDPNLGVKNPSFCDTDAYFGAADYSMRDVWDSAGR